MWLAHALKMLILARLNHMYDFKVRLVLKGVLTLQIFHIKTNKYIKRK